RRNLRRFAAQKFGRDSLLGDRMLHLAFLIEVPRPAIFRRAMLHAHPREEGRQAVEVILSEVLQRMVVTLGALHAYTEEEARNRRSRLLHIELLQHEIRRRMPEVRGWLLKGIVFAGDQLTHHLLVRLVL